jgi:hypothetical protein
MPDEPRIYLTGMKPIGEMAREELIEEIMINQRGQAEKLDIKNLRACVAGFRVEEAKQRIYTEAGIVEQPGFFGTVLREADTDDDD